MENLAKRIRQGKKCGKYSQAHDSLDSRNSPLTRVTTRERRNFASSRPNLPKCAGFAGALPCIRAGGETAVLPITRERSKESNQH